MGTTNSAQYEKKHKQLSMITLNYSGILLSPFEFFSKHPNEQELNKIQQNLSEIFADLLEKTYENFNKDKKLNKFKWNLGKIDQKMQKERYTPIYHKDAGVKNGKFMTLEQFQIKWTQVFDKQSKNIQGLEFKLEQKNDAKLFDLMCYKTILISLFDNQLKKDNQGRYNFTGIENLDTDKYSKFMQKMFKKSFLDESKKIQKTFKAFNNEKIDIAFVQQANESLIKQLEKRSKDYHLFTSKNSESIIVCRRGSFNSFFTNKDYSPLDFNKDMKQRVNWNNDTVIAFVDNLILISAHLSSKKQKNGMQTYLMIEDLKKLEAMYPMCHIIVGADGNSFLKDTYNDYASTIKKQEQTAENSILQPGLPSTWRIYPDDSKIITTSKQRTYLQPQVNKANEKAQVSRDYLIFLRSKQIVFKQLKVCTIQNKNIEEVTCLPCQQHPYDHYVVKGQVYVNVMTNLSQSSRKLQ